MNLSLLTLLAALNAVTCATFDQPAAKELSDGVYKDAYFVVFSSEPGSSAAAGEQQRFLHQAQAQGIQYRKRKAFNVLVNAVSVDANDLAISQLSKLPGVKQVLPLLHGTTPRDIKESTPDLAFTYPHSITGADKVHKELKFTGKGIKVGIIDSGIDYNHPSLGGCFGKGCKVAYGYDFADNDDDPMDSCIGHGTHVAGIVAAVDKDFVGVAPDVTLGAYRVGDCNGSISEETVIASMERAYQDGMDVVNLSLGYDNPWKQYLTAVAADKLVEKGVVVVAAAGNSGGEFGLWSIGAPAVGSKTLAVASFDSTRYLHKGFSVDGSDTNVNVLGAYYGMEERDFPLFTQKPLVHFATNNSTDCEHLTLPDDYRGKIVMATDQFCSSFGLANTAQKANAFALLIYTKYDMGINPLVDPQTTIPVAGVPRGGAEKLLRMMQERNITLSNEGKAFVFDNPTGGEPSGFSSWGPSAELEVRPDIAAVGGLVYSTFPLNKGKYATYSGTSMSSPYVAGSVALYLQAKGKVKPQQVIDALKSTARPDASSNSTVTTSVYKQGTGMVNVYDAITSTTTVTPTRLDLLSSDFKTGKLKPITITNRGKYARRYIISHQPAMAAVTDPNRPSFQSGVITEKVYSQVDFDTKDIVLQPGQSAKINLFFKPPTNADPALRYLLSGFIRVKLQSIPEDVAKGFLDWKSPMVIPYGGMYGKYRHVRVLRQGPNPLVSDEDPFGGMMLEKPGKFVFVKTDIPARSIKLNLVDTSNTVLGSATRNLIEYAAGAGSFLYPWNATYFVDGVEKKAEPGTYKFKAEALGPFEKDEPANWDVSYSDEFKVEYD